ncbi:hypothetical protein NOV72_04990 [Caballeronia novacaledonica]|uniref:Uncharacterized protein n=1 Tax=Caballeronia novacaledonica TaxID=1544861 RepID=A0A2U3IC51_9BURK|nr:hypothetical protein [Caballeronia novacaledonica]SPB17787.1 hypothetical protein NOV72_04990 [Caballeronia novacaledonica]
MVTKLPTPPGLKPLPSKGLRVQAAIECLPEQQLIPNKDDLSDTGLRGAIWFSVTDAEGNALDKAVEPKELAFYTMNNNSPDVNDTKAELYDFTSLNDQNRYRFNKGTGDKLPAMYRVGFWFPNFPRISERLLVLRNYSFLFVMNRAPQLVAGGVIAEDTGIALVSAAVLLRSKTLMIRLNHMLFIASDQEDRHLWDGWAFPKTDDTVW